ncbi:type VII secretion integral membrane protein EccD [Kitasatospora sp. NPDC048296]|uniref:type VII secretion integral membrane protein EccD n=1 Tax=Kitasatospora sp. NPDC048296 TaxID=3364048 RepID=UPI00371680D2
MSGGAVAGLCRLRFRAPDSAFELAVPSDVVLADLLPAVLAHAGAEVEEAGAEHSGWVLQRVGEEPLDEELTLDALGLRDGQELFLRPRTAELPPVHFDDLVDGVRSGMLERRDSWRPALTHHLAVASALTALAGGLALLLQPGPAQLRCAAAAVVAVLLLVGAGGATRTVGDSAAGTALGAAAIGYAVTAAALVPGLNGTDRLLSGGSAAAGATVLALAVVGASAPFFLSVLFAGLVALGAGVLALRDVPPGHSAAILACAAVLSGAFAPGLAFKLAGLRVPALPRNAEELQEDIEPFPAADVLARGDVADGYLTGFLGSIGLVGAACLTLLAGADGWGPAATAADLAALLLLHAREIGSLWQRLAVLLPGLYGLVLLAGRFGLAGGWQDRLTLVAVLLGVAAVLLVVAWTVPGRRLLPYWGRAADLLHSLTAFALLPLALQTLGFYHLMRGMAG